MTRRLPVAPAPGPLETYCEQFDALFRQHNQRDRFRRYLEGLLLPAERNKTLTALANTEPATGAQHPHAQSLQWFLSESTWDAEAVNGRRLAVLRENPVTAPTGNGVLVIDEHGDRKWGTKTAHIGRQYLANLGKIDTGVVSVTSLWADEHISYPLHVEPGTLWVSPAHHFPQGKADPGFRTKLAIAVELIQQAVNAGIPFRAVVADCFYGEDHGVQQGIRGLGKGYVLAQSLVRGEIAEIGVDLSTKSGFRTVIAEDRLGSRRPEEEAHRHRHPIWEIRVLCPVVLVPSVPGSCPRPHPSSPVKRLHSMPPWTRSWCAVSAPSPSSYPSWNRSISAPSSIATLSQPASRPPIKIGGLLALLLILNRLLAPSPLVHVETWLGETVLPDLLGIDAGQCNDDRLARTLDVLVPRLDALWQDLIVAAITTVDLDLSQVCYDITSVSFCGAYEDAELVRYGYSRDHRPDRKQLELGTTVTVDGGVPIDYRVLAGNVADRITPVENLARLQHLLSLLPPRSRGDEAPLVISDRAMLTTEALVAYQECGLHCLGPLDPALGQGAVRGLLEGVTAEELAAAELAYRPQRADRDPTWAPYHGVRRSLALPHPDPEQPALSITALVVWSPAKARLDAQLRTTQLTRLEDALADLAGKVGKRPYTTRTAVEKRVATLLRRHPARSYLDVTLRGGSDEEPLTLHWTRHEEALAEAARLDGRYVLGTTDPSLDTDQILVRSKRRDVPEKRFAALKGPLAVRPVYLHQEARIQALVFCTMVALLVFALLELHLHRAQLDLSGQALIAQFASVTVLILVFQDGFRGSGEARGPAEILRRLAGLSPPLVDLLQTLGVPPADRYLTPCPSSPCEIQT